jgi:hypothetical protein
MNGSKNVNIEGIPQKFKMQVLQNNKGSFKTPCPDTISNTNTSYKIMNQNRREPLSDGQADSGDSDP